MNITIITTCTNRKKSPVLMASSNLNHGDQDSVLNDWQAAHENVTQDQSSLTPVCELYGGRAFQEILLSKQESNADLWIISTGLGLLHWEDKVPSYSLTLSPASDDSIQKKVLNSDFNSAIWWKDINAHHDGRSISALIKNNKTNLFLMPISWSYLKMVEEDLLSLSDEDLKRVRIYGLLHSFNMHPRLRPLLLPYDERINDPIANNQGTRTDFAARCVRHFINNILNKSTTNTIEEHHKLVTESLVHLTSPIIEKRQKLPDDEIIKIIKVMIDRGINSSQAMLKEIRNGYHIACEQQRFASLVRQTKADLKEEE